MKINVEYFAKFREKSGKSNEIVNTYCLNVKDLYEELNKKYNFGIDISIIRVAINEEFSDWDSELKDNDTVVFIQPVAGG